MLSSDTECEKRDDASPKFFFVVNPMSWEKQSRKKNMNRKCFSAQTLWLRAADTGDDQTRAIVCSLVITPKKNGFGVDLFVLFAIVTLFFSILFLQRGISFKQSHYVMFESEFDLFAK
jgi:hypothetical protein